MRHKLFLASTALSTFAISLMLSSVAIAATVKTPTVQPKVVTVKPSVVVVRPNVALRPNVVVVRSTEVVRPAGNGSVVFRGNTNLTVKKSGATNTGNASSSSPGVAAYSVKAGPAIPSPGGDPGPSSRNGGATSSPQPSESGARPPANTTAASAPGAVPAPGVAAYSVKAGPAASSSSPQATGVSLMVTGKSSSAAQPGQAPTWLAGNWHSPLLIGAKTSPIGGKPIEEWDYWDGLTPGQKVIAVLYPGIALLSAAISGPGSANGNPGGGKTGAGGATGSSGNPGSNGPGTGSTAKYNGDVTIVTDGKGHVVGVVDSQGVLHKNNLVISTEGGGVPDGVIGPPVADIGVIIVHDSNGNIIGAVDANGMFHKIGVGPGSGTVSGAGSSGTGQPGNGPGPIDQAPTITLVTDDTGKVIGYLDGSGTFQKTEPATGSSPGGGGPPKGGILTVDEIAAISGAGKTTESTTTAPSSGTPSNPSNGGGASPQNKDGQNLDATRAAEESGGGAPPPTSTDPTTKPDAKTDGGTGQ